MPKYNVVGQVYLSAGFDYNMVADSKEEAEAAAREVAWRSEWTPEIQEVSVQATELVKPIIAKLTIADIDAGLALLEAAMDSDPHAKMWEGKPLHNVWAALASLINDTDAILLAKDEGVTA